MIDEEDQLPDAPAEETVTQEETSPYTPDPLPAPAEAPVAAAPAEENPFAKYASEQPVAQVEENPFLKYNSDTDALTSSATGAFARGVEKGIVPTATALPAIGFGATMGAELGAAAGPFGFVAGGFVGGLVGGAAGGRFGSVVQDFALSYVPDDIKKKMGLDEDQAIIDEVRHPYAAQIGGLVPFLVTARPWAAPGGAPLAATISKRVGSDLLHRGFSGAVMGGWEFGNEAYHGNVDWNKVAIATAFGTMFPHQNKYGTAVIETGSNAARYTLGQARDLGVFGPGHNEDTFQGDAEVNQVAKEASHQYARDEESEVQGPRLPGPDQVTDTARKMEPELFDEYDRLTAIKDEARAAIDEINNGSPKRVSELSKELVQAQRDYSEFVKGRNGYEGGREARVMRQNIRTIQNEISTLENRPMEHAETEGADNDLTARHRQELIKADEALRDLAPQLTEAKRRAAIGLGRGDFVIEPKPAEAAPAEVAQPDYTADRKAIAAEATKRAIEAGRPEEEAKAYGELTASRYISRAGRFEGKLGTPLELYHAEGSQIRSWEPAARPQPTAEPAKKVEPSQLPAAPAAAEKPVEVTGEVSFAPEAGAQPASEAAPAPELGVRARLAASANKLGIGVSEVQGKWVSRLGGIEIPPEDALVGARSPEHIFAHELAHAAISKRNLNFVGLPVAEIKKYIPNWNELVDASKQYRPEMWESDNPRAKAHARKPNEIIADAIGSVLLGERDISLLEPMMQSVGLKGRDLGLDVEVSAPAPAAELPAPEPAGPKAGDTITLNDTRYKIEAIDDNSVKLVAARKKDKALPLNLRRNVFDQMLGEHVAPAAKAEGEKITINGEPIDAKLAEVVRSLMAKQEAAPKETVPGRLPDAPDTAALREKMRQEAMSDEYPVTQEAAPDVGAEWQRFTANAQEAGQSPGFVKWDRLRSGSPNRARAKKDWTPGNIVDVGFVKDLLVVSKNEDGSFTLLGKPDNNGESQQYISEPHKGVSKEGKVDFLSATENLREPAPAAQPVEPTPIVQRVTTANGTAVDVKPMVVEAADLLTSSDAGYDQALQPRNRDRAASQGQIRDIATRLDPNRLGSSSEADRGAPIVGPDNMVESGNGRVMAIREAYRQNGQAAQRYRDWIASQGIDVAKYKEPVLVRQRVTEMTPEERKAFTVEANQSATLAMSASERAMADARMLTPDTLDLVQNPDDLGAIKNRGFVQAFVKGLPQSEQGMMTTAEGGLSSEGLARVRNAVLAKAYGDASLMARIAEATSDEVKSISNALTSAAPKWAKLRADVEAGLVRADMDLTPELMEAVKRTADLRSKGVKLDSFLAQQDAFDKLNPTVEAWMRMFYNATGRRAASAADIAERVNFYAQEARKVSAQEGLAFDLTPVRSEDVQALAAQKGKENGGSTDQANLFEPRSAGDGPRNEAGGQETGRQGTGEVGGGLGEPGAGKPESGRGNGEVFEQRRGNEERLGAYNTRTREIWLGKNADPSSIIHESGHQYLEELTRDAAHGEAPAQVKADLETVKDWVGWKRGQAEFTRKQHEKFAKGFERYIYDGVAPSKELASVFERFTNWLREVYQSIRGLKRNGIPELTPEIRSVFDRLLAAEPRRTVVAGEIKTASSLGAVHAAEAVKTTHREAGAKADRADNERAQFVKELPTEVKNELAAAAERNGRSVRELGGIDADGRGMAEDRGGQGARAGSGAGGQSGGAQRGGNGENAAEGFGASSGNDGNGYVPRERQSFASKEGKFVDKAGNIRLENVTNEADLREAAREVAAQNNDFIGDRRGVVTDGQVHDLATAIGDEGAWRMVDKWAKGSAYNAEEIMAMRLLFQKQLEKVVELAKAAKAAGDGDWQAMRDYAVERDRLVNIQKTVSGATAEWGRAGRSFRDISGSKDYKAVNKLFQENTGRTLFQTRVELDLLSKLDDPEAAANFLRQSDRPAFHRYILEYWINNLISGPITHGTYVVGNLLLGIYRGIPETLARAAIGRAMQAAGRGAEAKELVQFGEAIAQAKGFGEGFAPALKAAAGSFKTGVTTLLPGETMRNLPGLMPGQQFAKPDRMDPAYKLAQVMPDMFGAIRGMKDAVIAYGQLLDKGVDGAPLWSLYTSPLGVIPDIALKGVPFIPIGSAQRIPSRFIQAIHAFHRVQFYFMELNAEAYRRAASEGLTGDAFAQRVAELKTNPDLDMIKRSSDTATEGTMMGQGGEFTRKLAALVNAPLVGNVPLAKFIDPFVHITGNVIEQALNQRTPIGIFSPEIRADLFGKNGAYAQDKAIGRMMLGTAVSIGVMGYVMEGLITGGGPKDREEKGNWERLGIQPYSVKIGDTWYSYHRLGALGLQIGVAADMYKVAEYATKDEMTEAAAALHEAFLHNIFEESFMRGPSEFFRMIENPTQYGPSWIRNFASSFAPMSVGASQITRAIDPYSRQARTVMDAIMAKYPWSSGDLAPRRDLWGEPIANKRLTGPTAIYQSQENNDPVNREMYRLNVRKAPVDKKIRNITLSPEQRDDYARIAGRLTKMQLDQVINSPDYERMPDFQKMDVIEKVFDVTRKAARETMLQKYPQLIHDAISLKMNRYSDEGLERQ